MITGVFDVDAAGIVQRARIAAGACSPVAKRLPALEARMRGAPFGAILPCAADFDALAPIDDVRASAAYRRAAILQLTTDLIADAAQQRRAA
jgi:N-methylhydantoinase B